MLIYLKGKWPEQSLPEGEPLWLYYEVEEDRDMVTRTLEVFPDGLTLRNSVKLAEREGPDARHPQNRSLVHGNFLDEARHWLEVISDAEFNRLWDAAADKPWP
jgi:hypothetical protein